MKKFLIFICALIFLQSFSNYNVQAKSNTKVQIKSNPTKKAQLPDEIAKTLTIEDYANSYSELQKFIEQNKNISTDDINLKAIEILTKIYNTKEKSKTRSGIYLPKQYTDLNAEERKLAKYYPGAAITVYNCSKDALAASQARFSVRSLNDGNGDAFRHAYWNALMTKRLSFTGRLVSVSYGSSMAEKFATAHEWFYGPLSYSQSLSKSMDLNNNAVGRQIGRGAYTGGWGSFVSDSTIRDRVLNKVNSGGLRRISNQTFYNTNSNRSI